MGGGAVKKPGGLCKLSDHSPSEKVIKNLEKNFQFFFEKNENQNLINLGELFGFDFELREV